MKHDIVGVQQNQQFTFRFPSRQIIRNVFALILLPKISESAVEMLFPAVNQLTGSVFGAIVDDNQFEISEMLTGYALQSPRERINSIVCRDKD